MQISLEQRYEEFCRDSQELLELAGFAQAEQEPRLIGRPFYDACMSTAELHFPEDDRQGSGPVGLIYRMYTAFIGRGREVEGARAVAQILKKIMIRRPQPVSRRRPASADTVAGAERCPFHDSRRSYQLRDGLIFVLMPFTEEWSDRLWNDHIRVYLLGAVADSPPDVRRADDMFGQGVMEDVFEGIATAQLIVAECTGRNPNVLYELGIAHALGKRTALLSRADDDIPFDLRRFRFCIYSDNSDGYPKLRRFLEQTVLEAFG